MALKLFWRAHRRGGGGCLLTVLAFLAEVWGSAGATCALHHDCLPSLASVEGDSLWLLALGVVVALEALLAVCGIVVHNSASCGAAVARVDIRHFRADCGHIAGRRSTSE